MTPGQPKTHGLVGWVARHRAAVTFLLLFLMASPAMPVDDRQLLQANAGATAWVLLILDSSHSMNDEFSDLYRLPAYMDDFVYVENSAAVGPVSYGSKIGIAKSVVRDVIAKSEVGSGINWAFSYYRNPNQVLGAADYVVSDFKTAGTPIGGAKLANDHLENGGLEWLYFMQCVSNAGGGCLGPTIQSAGLSAAQYPDLQEGRFLQLGHKVMHNYFLDSRPPYTDNNPNTGYWRGAFGPHATTGTNRGTVIYRDTNATDGTGNPFEIRMNVITGNYGDPFIVVKLEKWGPPAAPTATVTQTPTVTATATVTSTPTITKTATVTKTETPTKTPITITPTFTASKTPTITQTPTKTSTPITPTLTQTPTITQTPTVTLTLTKTLTPSKTPTVTPSSTPTITLTPSNTFTPTNTKTSTQTPTTTLTPTKTPTPTKTATPTITLTPSNTLTPTKTFTFTPTFTKTLTPTITLTRTSTLTPTITKTFTATPVTPTSTNTPVTPTSTNTPVPPTKTNTPIPPTATKTPIPPTATNTFTPVPPTNTKTPTPVTPTKTNTRTFTPVPPSPTRTPTVNPSDTPTPFPTLGEGAAPASSLLPAAANWFAPAVRGLLAMAPPPPPLPTVGPCPGISGVAATKASCAPCWYDTTKLCAFYDANANKVKDPGEFGPSDPANPEYHPLPANLRGFDDPQADPDPTYTYTGLTIRVKYQRADLYNLPFADGTHVYDTRNNGNPPWGSCMTVTLRGCPVAPDGDADQVADTIGDRHNKGMYAALYDRGPEFLGRPMQQFPFDAFAGKSCPLDSDPCDPLMAGTDCGGLAHFATFTAKDGTVYQGSAPQALGTSPYVLDEPPAKDKWPVIPFARDWPPYNTGVNSDYPSPAPSSSEAIRKLLRFVSSIVTYNPAATVDQAYTLAENSTEIVATAPQTPLAGALEDAYEYFEQSVFKTATNAIQDPAIDCRNYIVVYITDGKDECNSDPCTGGRSGQGVAKDLSQIALPESAPGARAAAHAVDSSVRAQGIPVKVVAMANQGSPFYGSLTCIAGADPEGELFVASNRDQLEAALETILNFKRNANSFVAPAVPAFGSASGGDTAMIGAVIPSHENTNGVLSSWSVWSGSLKSYKLDTNGMVPVVVAASPTATPSPTPGGPTPGPSTPTPTAVPGTGNFPDESKPDAADESLRRPVWNAARVLGYTDPVANLTGGAGAASPGGGSGIIKVWPGRRMLFTRDAAASNDVPVPRADLLPNTGTCSGAGTIGSCFDDLMKYMGTYPWSVANEKLAKFTVQFLRGGQTTNGSANGIGRDEILNQVKPSTIPTIGPAADPQFSYYYQDDIPAPGTNPPQLGNPTDAGSSPPGYPHKLGDIFHSESVVVEPPRYFQYLSSNLTPPGTATPQPYLDFTLRNAKRRRVVYVGSNDGFLHAFDAGVFNGDTTNYPGSFDLGSGREIFAYSPRAAFAGGKFPALLDFSPQPQYFVDGSMGHADVFIDPEFNGAAGPDPSERVWRTVVVGGLRQGGSGYFALDVTQPDDIDENPASATYGEMIGAKTSSPNCLDGSGGSCNAGVASNRPYPSVMWEFTDPDPGAPCTDASTTGACSLLPAPALGETWSRPVIGRIKIISDLGPPILFEDRYVAIFGGGFDPSLDVADDPIDSTVGRAIYMVDVETGKILFKTSEGYDNNDTPINLGPMPAAAAAADYNDDGYLDVFYIGDTRGNMWRVDVTPDATAARGIFDPGDGQAHGYKPFQLFDTCRDVSATDFPKPPPKTGKNCVQPIFYEPGIVYLGGASTPPVLGIAFGTGDRSSLTRSNPTDAAVPPTKFEKNSFYYVIDGGSSLQTLGRTDLIDLSPPAVNPCVPYNPAICGLTGFVLDFETHNEKTTSTVFSTLGELSVVTFTPDSVSPCATNGSSFRYLFFYLTGQPGYTTPDYGGYKQDLGPGYAAAGQSVAPDGSIIDTVLFSGGGIRQDPKAASVQTIEQNWKEQQ